MVTRLAAASVPEAVVCVKQKPQASIYFFTDVIMPGSTGPELAARLLALLPSLRVVYMSGYTDGSVIAQGIIDGTSNFIQKPFTGELLARKVRTALDGTSKLAPHPKPRRRAYVTPPSKSRSIRFWATIVARLGEPRTPWCRSEFAYLSR